MRRHGAKLAGALALGLAVVAAAWLMMGSSATQAFPDRTGFHAYVDGDRSTYFAFTLDDMANPTGTAVFGVQGVGMIGMATPTFAIHGNHQIEIRYDGPATLQPDAVIDLTFGLNQPGKVSQQVSARLTANINTDKETANVEFWLDGKHYSAQGGRPANSPDRAFSAFVSALTKGDWGAIYDAAAPVWKSYTTRAQFISSWSSGWQSQFGTGPAQVRLASAPTLNDTGLGYWTAYAKLSISSDKASATYKVILQYVGHAWLLFDMSAS